MSAFTPLLKAFENTKNGKENWYALESEEAAELEKVIGSAERSTGLYSLWYKLTVTGYALASLTMVIWKEEIAKDMFFVAGIVCTSVIAVATTGKRASFKIADNSNKAEVAEGLLTLEMRPAGEIGGLAAIEPEKLPGRKLVPAPFPTFAAN
ncbi:MAG: hypothetical protein HGA90_00265 [Alphaproteobacteria bacterium]|nr:hypothetical protein [Alphaproteobacteria bacterium]